MVLGVSISWWDDGEWGVEGLQLIESRPVVVVDGERDDGGGCWVRSRLRHVLPLATVHCGGVEKEEEAGLQVEFVLVIRHGCCGWWCCPGGIIKCAQFLIRGS